MINNLYNSRCPTCGQHIRKPRSTGKRSQNSRVWGDCSSICFQLNERAGKVICTSTMVYDMMKRFAVAGGVYPGIKFTFGGIILIEPMSQSLVTMKEDAGLCDTINDYADKNDMWLWEYMPDGKTKYKSIGGRTLEEMNRDYPGLNNKKGK
jgi:hypothetical protein